MQQGGSKAEGLHTVSPPTTPSMQTLLHFHGQRVHDAAELDILLSEAGLLLSFSNPLKALPSVRSRDRGTRLPTLLDRVRQALPLDISPTVLDWSRLVCAVSSEALCDQRDAAAMQVDMNSGGRVLFCLFSLTGPGAGHHIKAPRFLSDLLEGVGGVFGSSHHSHAQAATGSTLPTPGVREGIVVLKFTGSRLLAQAEQLACELATHCGIASPASRIVHQSGSTATEWLQVEEAASVLLEAEPSPLSPSGASHMQQQAGLGGQELTEELEQSTCALLLEFVPGSNLASSPATTVPGLPGQVSLAQDLGRLFALDMVLGNADRLPCISLGWRGNPGNLLLGNKGSKYAGRAVAIDACVQRRPPAAKLSREDQEVDRLAQLVRSDPAGQVVAGLLRDQLLAHGPSWMAAALLTPPQASAASAQAVAHSAACVAAFQQGMQRSLQRVAGLKGLFEMVHQRTEEMLAAFISDLKAAAPQLNLPSPRHSQRRPGGLRSGPGGTAAQRFSMPGHDVAGGGLTPATPHLPRRATGDGNTWVPAQVGTAYSAPTRSQPPPGRLLSQAPRTPASAPPLGGHPKPVAASAFARTPPIGITPTEMASAAHAANSPLQQVVAALPRTLSLTFALKAVGQEKRSNIALSHRVDEWRVTFRQHAEALRTAVDEWQMRHGFATGGLTLGFLSGAQPIVDLYELKVRLDHMLRRMRVLEEAAAAVSPIRILDDFPLYLGNALAADSHHVLRHLGITHILNATEEVAAPPDSAGFVVLRLPLRDTEGEDIAAGFTTANDFIDAALGLPPAARVALIKPGARSPSTPKSSKPSSPATSKSSKPSSPAAYQAAPSQFPRSISPCPQPNFHPSPSATPPPVTSSPFQRPSQAGQTRPPLSPALSRGSHSPSPYVKQPSQSSGQLPKQASPVKPAQAGGGVLVHCSEGRSRSVCLIAAYLVERRGMTLLEALTLIKRRRPEASPNAGFSAALVAFERRVCGNSSVEGATGEAARAALGVLAAKRKPEAIKCPVCSAAVGLSTASLRVHVRSKHPQDAAGLGFGQVAPAQQ